jgi:hypothetical protein
MGVRFDRVLDDFSGPFAKLTDAAKPPAGKITGTATAGYYFTHQANDSFIVINRLLKAGEDVSWLQNGPMGRGTFYVAARPTTRALVEKAASEFGLSFEAATTAPTGTMAHLKAPRIGLFDTYGNNNMPSGWTRLILENFEFPYERVFPPDLDKGGLHEKYDVSSSTATASSPQGAARVAVDVGVAALHLARADGAEADAPASPHSRFPRSSHDARVRSARRRWRRSSSSCRKVGPSSPSRRPRWVQCSNSACPRRIISSKTTIRSRARSSTSPVRC